MGAGILKSESMDAAIDRGRSSRSAAISGQAGTGFRCARVSSGQKEAAVGNTESRNTESRNRESLGAVPRSVSLRRFSRTILGIVLLLVVWQLAASSGIWSAYVLPPPLKVAKALGAMIQSGVLLRHILVSSRRVLVGFSIAFSLAMAGGTIASQLRTVEEYYGGFLEFLRNVPPISLIALLILWFGIGETSKIIIIVLASFFPMYLNIRKGFVSGSRKLLEVGQVFGLSAWQRFCRITLPSAVPDILVGMRIGLGYSWRAIIGAEMIAAASGLGYLILDAQQMSRSDRVMAGILTIGTVGILSDKLFSLVINRTINARKQFTNTL